MSQHGDVPAFSPAQEMMGAIREPLVGVRHARRPAALGIRWHHALHDRNI